METNNKTVISQAALAFVNSQKSQWLEMQLLSAIDQVLNLQVQIKNLEKELQEEKDKNGSTT